MGLFPKVEMKWSDTGLYLKAKRTCRNQVETEWFVRRFSLVSGFMTVLLAFIFFWSESTFTDDPTKRTTLFQRSPELPFRFALGYAFAYFGFRIFSFVPGSYRILDNGIDFVGGNRLIRFDRIERIKLHDFGAFRVIELTTRDLGTKILGAPANLDFAKMRGLFETRGIAFETSVPALRWPEKAAVQRFDAIIAATRKPSKADSKASIATNAKPPAPIVLFRSSIAVAGIMGTILTLSLFFGRAYDDWMRRSLRLDTMKAVAALAKDSAGENWPNVRPRYERQLKAEGKIAIAMGDRLLNRGYLSLLSGFAGSLAIIFFIFTTCFERFG